METDLNPEFLERMQSYLPEEYEAYLESLQQPLYQGLRANPKKMAARDLEARLPFLQGKSPFSKDAWYISGHYGNHPLHQAGAFYLQEPSASAPVQILNVQPDDLVLDLCAAPGSKSTQILSQLESGFLLSNEFDGKRAQSLLSNMERMGAENFMVTNMDTSVLTSQLPETFDKILVDAPCSGEGMMKKHDAARNKWSLENIQACAALQKEILANAHTALAPGGELVYSTCTYAKEENEDNVAWFLQSYPDMELLDIDVPYGRSGLPTQGIDASKVRRIFPMDKGEGHFIARFGRKAQESGPARLPELKSAKADPLVSAFLNEQMEDPYPYLYSVAGKEGSRVYGMRRPFWKLKKGTILRQGVYLGDQIKKRFEPTHAFFMAASQAESGKRKAEVNAQQLDDFLHGMQLDLSVPRGYTAVCYEGLPVGFGKSDGKRITNKLPKGLRLPAGSHIQLPEASAPNTALEEDMPEKGRS